jgi:hypothetical protein
MADFGLSAIIGAVGSAVSGFAALAAGNYQNKVAQMNASIAEDNAKRSIERAQIEQQDQDMITLGMLGEQESVQAASGISLNSKSSIRTRKAARELGRRDALNIRQGGELEAYGYKTEAVNQRAQGQLAKSAGVSNMLGSFLGAAGSLVGGSTSVANPARYTNDPWRTKAGTNLRYAS